MGSHVVEVVVGCSDDELYNDLYQRYVRGRICKLIQVIVVGCWLLVVGCWLLVVGCWLLVVVCLYFVFLANWHSGIIIVIFINFSSSTQFQILLSKLSSQMLEMFVLFFILFCFVFAFCFFFLSPSFLPSLPLSLLP